MDEQPGAQSMEAVDDESPQVEGWQSNGSCSSDDRSDDEQAEQQLEGDPSHESQGQRYRHPHRGGGMQQLRDLMAKVDLLQRQSEQLTRLSQMQRDLIQKHAYREGAPAANPPPLSAAAVVAAAVSSPRSTLSRSRNPFTTVDFGIEQRHHHPPPAGPPLQLKVAVPLRQQAEHAELRSPASARASAHTVDAQAQHTAAAAAASSSSPVPAVASPASSCSSSVSGTGSLHVPVPRGSPEPSRVRSHWEMRRAASTRAPLAASSGAGPGLSDDPSPCLSPQRGGLEREMDGEDVGEESDEEADGDDDRASLCLSMHSGVTFSRGPPSMVGSDAHSLSSSLWAQHAPSLLSSTVRSFSPSATSASERTVRGPPGVHGQGLGPGGGGSIGGEASVCHYSSDEHDLSDMDEFEALHEIDEQRGDESDSSASQSDGDHSSSDNSRSDGKNVSAAPPRAPLSASSPPLTASSLAHLNRAHQRLLQQQRHRVLLPPRSGSRSHGADQGHHTAPLPAHVATSASSSSGLTGTSQEPTRASELGRLGCTIFSGVTRQLHRS